MPVSTRLHCSFLERRKNRNSNGKLPPCESFTEKKEELSFICEWDAKPESTPETLATIIKDGKEEAVPVEILEFGGHYYKLFTGVCSSYAEAKKYCEDMGGMLCSVTSEEENLALYGYMTEYGFKSAYIGYSDSEAEGCWTWETGEAADFEAWTKNVRFKH